MSLPPGFLDELRTRTSLAQVAGRKVAWDLKKSNQGKGDMWAPCPFHQEKTASFHVDDKKGFYYCFGCHAKGDAISFVRETENVGFMEAVEILAREASMTMPARDPQAQAKADRNSQLAEVMEQAVQHYRLQLRTGAAAEARDYLTGRGLTDTVLDRWEIGFAPDARRGLFEHLRAKGVDEALIIEAGLAAKPDDGGPAYDRFRGRILFPIRDARGRAIALGGRAMDPNARAKYLNSPETPLFDKGRSLYNHGPAREAAGKGQPLIIAEGYMDVIALSEAGFGATVAPLGTAITEDQLRMAWRMHSEPVVALDGDTAGLRAAMRAMDLALPLIEAGQSLRFVLMPEGKDPDDLIRAEGAGAMQRLVEGALPMVQLLWRRETDGQVFDSPERKAALDKRLREALKTIRDPSLRSHYGAEINRLRQELFRGPDTRRRPGGWRRDPPRAPLAGTRASPLASAGEAYEDELREAVILATLVTHPDLVERFESDLERLDTSITGHEAIRTALLRGGNTEEIAELAGAETLEKLFSARHVQLAPGVRDAGASDLAALCVAEELAKLSARRGARRDIAEAAEDLGHLADEGVTWRLSQAAEATRAAWRGQHEDKTEYEVAPNGARLALGEKAALEEALSKADPAKGGRRRP